MGEDMKKAMLAVTDGVIGAAVLLAAGVYGGGWLDRQLHTSPWLSVGLAMLGGGLGLARMVYRANQLGKNAVDDPLPKRSVLKQSAAEPEPSPPGSLRQKRPFEDLDDEQN